MTNLTGFVLGQRQGSQKSLSGSLEDGRAVKADRVMVWGNWRTSFERTGHDNERKKDNCNCFSPWVSMYLFVAHHVYR